MGECHTLPHDRRKRRKAFLVTSVYRVTATVMVLLALGVGVALSLIFWHVAEQQQYRVLDGLFQIQASNSTASIVQEIQRINHFLVGLSIVFQVTGYELNPYQFLLYSTPFLQRWNDARSIFYSPVVTLAERPYFEEDISNEHGQPIEIWQVINDSIARAPDRPEYLPVSIIFPADNATNELLGLDVWAVGLMPLTSLAAQADNVTCTSRSRLSPNTTISIFHTIDSDPTSQQYGTICAMPIFFKGPVGAPVGFLYVYAPVPVIVCSVVNCNDTTLEIFMFDTSAPPGNQYLFQLVREYLARLHIQETS